MSPIEIRLLRPGHFEGGKAEPREPAPGEALLRLRRLGVCGTDIHAYHGRQPFFDYPRILGHEIAAEIVSLNGEAEGFVPGQLVAVEPYLNDPDSPASRKGRSNCCEALRVIGVHCDGAMRSEFRHPISKLHPVGALKPDAVALTEMLAIGCHAVNRACPQPGERALVVGAGPIGLGVIAFLRPRLGEIAVLDQDERRHRFASGAFGVASFSPGDSPEATEAAVRRHFGGDLPDLVFDATGSAASMELAPSLAAHGGRIVFVGIVNGPLSFHDPDLHRKELTLLASRNATSLEIREVLTHLESGRIDIDPWLTHRLQLGEVPERFAGTVADPTLRKAVVHWDG